MDTLLLLAMSHKVSLPTLEKKILELQVENNNMKRAIQENNKHISRIATVLNQRRSNES